MHKRKIRHSGQLAKNIYCLKKSFFCLIYWAVGKQCLNWAECIRKIAASAVFVRDVAKKHDATHPTVKCTARVHFPPKLYGQMHIFVSNLKFFTLKPKAPKRWPLYAVHLLFRRYSFCPSSNKWKPEVALRVLAFDRLAVASMSMHWRNNFRTKRKIRTRF